MKFLAINPQISTDVLDCWFTFFCCQLQNAVKTKTFWLVQVLSVPLLFSKWGSRGSPWFIQVKNTDTSVGTHRFLYYNLIWDLLTYLKKLPSYSKKVKYKFLKNSSYLFFTSCFFGEFQWITYMVIWKQT